MLRKGGVDFKYGKRKNTQAAKTTTQEKKTSQKEEEIEGPDLVSRLAAEI